LSDEEKRARFEKSLLFGGDTHSVEDVVQLVREGRAQFWSGGDGSILSEVLTLPRAKVINLWVLSGNLPDIIALEPTVCNWGRDQGCTIATASGRKGWGRVGAPLGWMPWHWTFRKELT
jgi:hypothetical protein